MLVFFSFFLITDAVQVQQHLQNNYSVIFFLSISEEYFELLNHSVTILFFSVRYFVSTKIWVLYSPVIKLLRVAISK